MNQDPIERLLWEHQGIMRQVADLRTAITRLARDGGVLDEREREEVARVMETLDAG